MKLNDLYHYQEKAVKFILDNPKCALWLGMSLGKTVSTLTAIVKLYESKEIKKVLIVAPLRVCNSVWEQESRLWDHTRHLTFCNLAGGKANRVKAATSKADIFLINRETIHMLLFEYSKRWNWDMIVIDESSSVKNQKSQRFKALKKVISFTKRMVQLTGTPATNSLEDIYSQIYLLDQGERLGRTLTAFRSLYFTQKYNGFGYQLRSESCADTIHSKVKDIVISMQTEDYLELPPVKYVEREIILSPAIFKKYKDFEKDFIYELNSEKSIDAPNIAILQNKLSQTANGTMYDEDRNIINIHSEKLDELEVMVEEAQGEPILLAYNYKHDMQRILDKFPQAELVGKNAETIERWNSGEIPMLLGHPMSLSHGVNMQNGGHIMIWYGLPWSLELYQQFNARLHRTGQKNQVSIYHLIAQDTVEQKILKVLGNKDLQQQSLLNALKYEMG
tara:strand:- start:1012 stop:2355 length:1344 start_codon:yes stop_codon:yes gene_type:complete